MRELKQKVNALILILIALPVSAQDKPNIVFMMADNLGYGDLGSYGGGRGGIIGGAIGGAVGGSPGGAIGGAFDPASLRLAKAGNVLKAGKGGLLGGVVSDLASAGLGKIISECDCE